MAKTKPKTIPTQIESLSPAELAAVIDHVKNPQPLDQIVQHHWSNKHTKIGICSDLHIGSKFQDQGALEDAFKRFKAAGVDAVYIAGDITEGYNMRPGHSYECNLHGADDQAKGVIERVPQIGKPIYFINGDHDHSHFKNSGHDIGPAISEQRKDMTYLGFFNASVELGKNAKLELVHPAKGTSYALCFDDETEILTDDGWKFFKDLSRKERVATLNKSRDTFEWEKPTTWTDEEFSGEMIHFSNRCVDLLVTPNHRMFGRRYPGTVKRKERLHHPTKSHQRLDLSWKFVEAKDLLSVKRQRFQMKRGGQSWLAENSVEKILLKKSENHSRNQKQKMNFVEEMSVEDFAELVGWYVTEGSMHKKRKQVVISQSPTANPDSCEIIKDLLGRIGYRVGVYGKSITVSSKQLCALLADECGVGSRNKFIPKWLKEQSSGVLNIIFQAMIAGDGWINGEGFGYRSISKKLIDDMSEIAIKLGFGVTRSLNGESLSISNVQIYPTINSPPKKVRYSGRIYCVSVPNQIILVRRNGRAIWTGNSYQIQKLIESMEAGSKPNLLAVGHYHKVEQLYYRNVHAFQTGCFRGHVGIQTKHGVKRIANIRAGELVLTHTGTYEKVTKKFVRRYTGNYVTVSFGKTNHIGTQLVATEEHPVLIERRKQKRWVKICDIHIGDLVFIQQSHCKLCGTRIPYYNVLCKNCNPMHQESARAKLSTTLGGSKLERKYNGTGQYHLDKDILPFCETMRKDGWSIVPVGAGVIPDAVGFKNGKVVAFELESQHGKMLQFKKSKYKDATIAMYLDEVRWIDTEPSKPNSNQGEYFPDDELPFVKVFVTDVRVKKSPHKSHLVHNLEVHGANSFVASRVVVHNCLESQTGWMRRMNISAHKGAWILDVYLHPERGVDKLVSELIPYYD